MQEKHGGKDLKKIPLGTFPKGEYVPFGNTKNTSKVPSTFEVFSIWKEF